MTSEAEANTPRGATNSDPPREEFGVPGGNAGPGGEHRGSVVEERRRASVNLENKDHRDAAQVPPSVLKKQVGEPKPDTQEEHDHRGLSLGALGHHGHHAVHGRHKGEEKTV